LETFRVLAILNSKDNSQIYLFLSRTKSNNILLNYMEIQNAVYYRIRTLQDNVDYDQVIILYLIKYESSVIILYLIKYETSVILIYKLI
jgi:hypothetical protein